MTRVPRSGSGGRPSHSVMTAAGRGNRSPCRDLEGQVVDGDVVAVTPVQCRTVITASTLGKRPCPGIGLPSGWHPDFRQRHGIRPGLYCEPVRSRRANLTWAPLLVLSAWASPCSTAPISTSTSSATTPARISSGSPPPRRPHGQAQVAPAEGRLDTATQREHGGPERMVRGNGRMGVAMRRLSSSPELTQRSSPVVARP